MVSMRLELSNYREFAIPEPSEFYQPRTLLDIQTELAEVERDIAEIQAKPAIEDAEGEGYLDEWERRQRLDDLRLEAKLLREELAAPREDAKELATLQYVDERMKTFPYRVKTHKSTEAIKENRDAFNEGVRLAVETLEHADDLREGYWRDQLEQVVAKAEDSWLMGEDYSEATQRELDRLLGAMLVEEWMLLEWESIVRRSTFAMIDRICHTDAGLRVRHDFDRLFIEAVAILEKAKFPKSDDRSSWEKESLCTSISERKAFEAIAKRLLDLKDAKARILSAKLVGECLTWLRKERRRPIGSEEVCSIARNAEGNASCDREYWNEVCRYEWEPVDFNAFSRQFIASWVHWLDLKSIEANRPFEARLAKWKLLDKDAIALLQHAKAYDEANKPEQAEPGSQANDLYHVPGLVSSIMNLTLETAAYPNRELAFCGALTLVSLLVGRRVTFNQLAPNVYIVAIASSGSGKDQPRRVNIKLLESIGMGDCINDALASGEGLEDAIADNPLCLCQLDELDHLIRSIAGARESRFQSISERLLRLFTSSNSTYYVRRRAGMPQKTISRPYLVLLGNCTPTAFWDSLGSEMLSNGLFARMLTVHVKTRGERQVAKAIEPGEDLIQELQYWKDFDASNLQGREGNLESTFGKPFEIPADEAAKARINEARDKFDAFYRECEAKRDEAGMSIWARAGEHAIKLAAIYACSIASGELPKVTIEAVEWATRFMERHTVSILEQARDRVTETQFAKDAIKMLDRIAASREGISHSALLKFSHKLAKEFREIMATLIESGRVSEAMTDGRKHYVRGSLQ